MNYSQWEKALLEYYQNNYKAKWMRVFSNKHTILATKVIFYSTFKRKLKKQAYCGELTFSGMFRYLNEGDWYFIPNLLNDYKRREDIEKG